MIDFGSSILFFFYLLFLNLLYFGYIYLYLVCLYCGSKKTSEAFKYLTFSYASSVSGINLQQICEESEPHLSSLRGYLKARERDFAFRATLSLALLNLFLIEFSYKSPAKSFPHSHIFDP